MPIKDRPTIPPSRRVGNILLFVATAFLLINLLFPQLFTPPIPQVPYSLFIDQVQDGQVSRVSLGEREIRYQLKATEEQKNGQILRTTPIFDLELPKKLEANGVEFAAAPPAGNAWISNILSWVIPPLIFVAIWQFFLNRSGGGPVGALSIAKSKAKVYVENDETKVTFADVAGVEEAKTELTEIVNFSKVPRDLLISVHVFLKECY